MNDGSRRVLDVILQGSRAAGLTLRDAGYRYGVSQLTPALVGTAKTVADRLQDMFELHCCDGFVICPSITPGTYMQFVKTVVPELQRRDIYRTDYAGKTLRETSAVETGARRPRRFARHLLRLDHLVLRLLRRLLAPGRRRRHAVRVRRANDRFVGWSRTAMSGAVSLGGLLAAFAAPLLGRALDRVGPRLVLCAAVLTTGAANLLLSLTSSLAMFYVLFCIARTNFAGPFDLGIYGAVNNWFVVRRTLANGIATVAQMSGLVRLPLIAECRDAARWLACRPGSPSGLRCCWSASFPRGSSVPRPEDIGLLPDRRTHAPNTPHRPRTALQPRASLAHTRLLDALAVRPVRLSGASRCQPASGTIHDRARAQPNHSCDHRQHVLR